MNNLNKALCRLFATRRAAELAEEHRRGAEADFFAVLARQPRLAREEEVVLRTLPSMKMPFRTKDLLVRLGIPSSTQRAGSVSFVLQKWRKHRTLLDREDDLHFVKPEVFAAKSVVLKRM